MINLIPSLGEVIIANKMDVETICLVLPMGTGKDMSSFPDRNCVGLSDAGSRIAEWRVPSLRQLFRGTKVPPKDMDHYPQEYHQIFFTIEKNVLFAGNLVEIRDEEIARLYSVLRRIPDGRSEGFLHDILYQAAALMLGINSISQAEFESIFGQLAASARGWRESYSSKNYITYLRENLKQDENEDRRENNQASKSFLAKIWDKFQYR